MEGKRDFAFNYVHSPLNIFKAEHGSDSKHHSAEEVSISDLGFTHAFIAALSVIIVSELGDKTFFIAAIMAMRHSRLVVFAGAILALIVMTILSGNYKKGYLMKS